jgi:hypothetical protein
MVPGGWNTWIYERGGNDHSYIGKVNVRDITSGIDVSTAEYAYYTRKNSC